MPFDMYGDVILTRDVAGHGLRAGDVGTVVERHIVPGGAEEGYSVEFFDMTGNTVGVAFVSLAEGIDATTPAGRLQLHVLGAIAEFERDRIRERVMAGLQRAKAQGTVLGRPRL